MIVLIATLFGITDIATLVVIFLVNAAMNLFGLDMELLNAGTEKKNVNWGPFIWGSLAGIAPWIAIYFYIFGTGNFDQTLGSHGQSYLLISLHLMLSQLT